MGLDVWFREDVARILASTQEAMRAVTGATAPLDPEAADVYRQGFSDALQAVGVAFGVAVPEERAGDARISGALLVDGRGWRREPVAFGRAKRRNTWPE